MGERVVGEWKTWTVEVVVAARGRDGEFVDGAVDATEGTKTGDEAERDDESATSAAAARIEGMSVASDGVGGAPHGDSSS